MKTRLLNILTALDQLLWVCLTLGKGFPDETISAGVYRLEQKGRISGRILRPIIDLLFRPLQREHCRLSFEAELRGAQLPKEYERACQWQKNDSN